MNNEERGGGISFGLLFAGVLTIVFIVLKLCGVILDKLVAENKLSKMQADTIINANKVKPITLTPDMIFKRGRGNNKRSPLGMNPQTKKKWNFGIKFVTTLITSVLMSVIACEVIIAIDSLIRNKLFA